MSNSDIFSCDMRKSCEGAAKRLRSPQQFSKKAANLRNSRGLVSLHSSSPYSMLSVLPLLHQPCILSVGCVILIVLMICTWLVYGGSP